MGGNRTDPPGITRILPSSCEGPGRDIGIYICNADWLPALCSLMPCRTKSRSQTRPLQRPDTPSGHHRNDLRIGQGRFGVWLRVRSRTTWPPSRLCRGRAISFGRGACRPGVSFVWLHFNVANAASERWLRDHLSAPEAFLESLHDATTSTRVEQDGEGVGRGAQRCSVLCTRRLQRVGRESVGGSTRARQRSRDGPAVGRSLARGCEGR